MWVHKAALEQQRDTVSFPREGARCLTSHVNRIVRAGAFVCAMAVLLLCGSIVTGEEAFAEPPSSEARFFSTEGFDRPVSYRVVFDANGGAGEMAAWELNIAPIDTSPRSLPACGFTREGYEFSHWETVCPAVCKLNAASLRDEQEFSGLSWQPDDASAQQTGWMGPLTLQSYANEEHQIVLKAIWRNTETGALSNVKRPIFRVSSTGVQTLYVYHKGYHSYLSTGSAPSGYGDREALTVVPQSSSTPVYILHNPYEPEKYHFTMYAKEYNNLGSIGWTRQGVAFYSDDAQGIPVYRFYRPSADAHGYSLSPDLSGYGDEYISCYGVKYYSLAFDGNGATGGSLAPWRLQYGLNYTLPNCPFTWADHSFVGWRGSNGGAYAAGQSVSNLTTTSEGTVTMSALWKLSCYRVSFDSNGGNSALPVPGVVTGADYIVNDPGCTFSRAGYEFAGWNTQPDGTGLQLAPHGSVKLQGDSVNVTLYAQWKPLQLELSVPTRIDLSVTARGAVSSDEACAIKNTGLVGAELTRLQAVQNGALGLVREDPQRNQIALLFDDAAGNKVNLFDCAGESAFELPKSQGLFVAAGQNMVPRFSGTCGSIDADKWDGFQTMVAQVRWGFATADATLGYVLSPQAEALVQQGNVGDRVTVASCSEQREGYRFVGWNTDEAGSGTTYMPGETLVCEQDINLYAQWERV